MNKNFRKVLAFPYILWMVGFTIIPLSLIFIYGLRICTVVVGKAGVSD